MGLAIPAGGVDLPARRCGLSASSGTAMPLLLLERVDSPLEASQDLLEEIGLLPGSGELRNTHGPILGKLAALAAALPAVGALILVPQVSRTPDTRPKVPGS
jgi:hypothetical protein